MEAQVSLTVAFSSSTFFGLLFLFLIFLLTIPGTGEFAGQSSTPTSWSFNQLLVLFGSVGRCQILLENEISIFKKLVSRRKHEVLQNFLVNGCSDVGFQKNTMDQHQQMTLHPKSSQTVETLDFMQLGL